MEGTSVGTEMGKIIQRVVLACVLLTAGLGSALAQATSEPEALARAAKFADQVVRVIPQRTDGASPEVGFGLIVGERAGKVYIATPHHVVFGLKRPSVLSAEPGVVFHGDRYNTIPARRLDRASAPDDLAVLEVAPPQGLALRARQLCWRRSLRVVPGHGTLASARTGTCRIAQAGSVHRTPSPGCAVSARCVRPQARREGRA
jgi:hypothetical protein